MCAELTLVKGAWNLPQNETCKLQGIYARNVGIFTG